MLPKSIARQTVIVHEPARTLDHGNEVPDYDKPFTATTAVAGCSVQPSFGSEDSAHRDANESLFTVWLPTTAPVTEFSLVSVPQHAGLLAVLGEPLRWLGLGLGHIEIQLIAWAG